MGIKIGNNNNIVNSSISNKTNAKDSNSWVKQFWIPIAVTVIGGLIIYFFTKLF